MAEKRRFTQGTIGATRLYSNGSPTQVPGQIGRSPEGLKTMPAQGRTITFNPDRPGNLPLAMGTLGIPYNTSGRRMSTNVEDRRSPLMPMVSQFGQLPQPFQDRFRQRQQMGLNQGMSEQQAVDFYNANYISGAPLPQGMSRQGGLAPQQGSALQPPGYLSGIREIASGVGQTLMDAGRYAGGAARGAVEGLSNLSGSARGAGGVSRERIYPPVTEGYPLDEAVKDIGNLPGSGRGLSGLGGLSGMLRRPAETAPQIQQTPQQGTLTGPIAQPPSPNPPPPATTPRFQGMSLADQLEQQRLAGQGMFAGPNQQERDQFNAAVVDRIRQNPSPISQFMGQELMGRTREGRQIGMRDLEQGYLSRPMQGGMMRGSTADTMRDRERRLTVLGSANPPRDTGAELTQTRMAQDLAVNEELARQGTTPEQLAEIARLTGRPEIANGGMAAASILRPGTTIRGMGGGNVPFTVVRGPEQSSERREQRLAGLPARQERDRLAVASRLDRMRMGRQTMMANQQAAQRQAMEMATNPIANPMLLSGSPGAQAEAMRLGQQQREFLAGAPIREAQMLEQSLRNQGLMYQNQASQQMLTPEYQMQQRQERARDLLTRIDPAVIAAMGPDGQRFMQGLYRDAAGLSDGQTSGPPAPPTTAVEAQGVVQQLSPSVQAVIGDDPENYNSEELAYKLNQMQDLGMQITPQDIQTINEYSAARTMYDTRFATTGRSRASRIFE